MNLPSSFLALRSVSLACGLALGAAAAVHAAPDTKLLAAAERRSPR